jgi:hypothetical protein
LPAALQAGGPGPFVGPGVDTDGRADQGTSGDEGARLAARPLKSPPHPLPARAKEDGIAKVEAAGRTLRHGLNLKAWVELVAHLGYGMYLRAANVVVGISFNGLRGTGHCSMVDELEPPDAECCQLHGDLPADPAEANDRGVAIGQW